MPSGPHNAVNATTEQPPATEPAATSPESAVIHAVEAILRQRGFGTGQYPISPEDMQKQINAAARALPLWAQILFGVIGLIGVPAIGSFVTTAQAVWELPAEIEQIKTTQAEQGKSLKQIKKSLKIPTSQPAEDEDE